MKKNVLKILISLSFILLFSEIVICQTNNSKVEFGDKYYVVNNSPPKSSSSNLIISIITSLISIGSIFIVWYNVKKQIKSVEENINKQFKLQEINNIREYIAEFVFEILEPDGGKLEQKEYVSTKHKKLEQKILFQLDDSSQVDKKLIKCISKFKNEKITNKNAWVFEIQSITNKLVTNKKQ